METTSKWVQRPWGRYMIVYTAPGQWTKTLQINEWSRLSLQKHEKRTEIWHAPEGRLTATIGSDRFVMDANRLYVVPPETVHRIENITRYPLILVEVALGLPDENDIIRLEDDYGRED